LIIKKKKEGREKVMKGFFIICYRGSLNGERKVFIDLCIIELNLEDKRVIPDMFQYDLMNCLYEKRGKGELGPKNGPGTNGWLDVLKIFKVPEKYESEVIRVASADLNEVYKTIRPHLKKVIAEKIKIKRKGE
jgi:hypothetical protein